MHVEPATPAATARTIDIPASPGGATPAQTHDAFLNFLDGDATPGKPQKRAPAAKLSDDEAANLASQQAEAPGEEDETAGPEADDDRVEQRDDDAPDSDPDTDSDDDEPDPTLLQRKVRIKADGVEEDVTVDELRKGYQRHKDYSQKTAAVAERARIVDTAAAQVLQQREALDGVLRHQQALLAEMLPQRPTPEQWNQLYQTNPLEFVRLQADFTQNDRAIAALQEQRTANARQAATQHAHLAGERVRVETERLLEKLPELRDPAKGKAAGAAVATYLTSQYGFTPQEVDLVDHRHFLIADKARKFDELVAKGKSLGRGVVPRAQAPAPVAPQRPTAPRPAEPGAAGVSAPRARPTELAKAKARLARSGRTEDAADAFAQLL